MRVLISIAIGLASGAALLVGVTATAPAAAAQITTVVVPPRPARARRVVAATADSARRADSAAVLERRLISMREWVDSAALALGAAPSVPENDSVGVVERPTDQATDQPTGQPVEPRRARAPDEARGEPVFREGAMAPATASPLPLILALSGVALVAGAFLRRG